MPDSLNLEDFLPYRLVNLATHVSQSLGREYQHEFGITIPEWRVIANLGQREFLTPSALAGHAQMDKAKVSRTIARLVEHGLVARTAHEGDKRAYWLKLTADGLKLYQAIVPKALAWESELLGILNGTEYRDLIATIDRLEAHLAEKKKSPGD